MPIVTDAVAMLIVLLQAITRLKLTAYSYSCCMWHPADHATCMHIYLLSLLTSCMHEYS